MTDPIDLADDRLTTVGLLLEAHSVVIGRMSRVHQAHGLLGKDFDVLLRLSRSPGRSLRMTELADQTGTSTSGITSVVERLMARGLVHRSASSSDRRSFVATLTDDGHQAVLNDVRDLLPVIQDAVITPLGTGRGSFVKSLRAIRGKAD